MSICTSAPVVCQAVAVSPRAMPVLTIPAKVARVSARTSANAGSSPVSEDRAAADSATKPVAPAPRADSRSRPRTASGYSRSMISTTGTATSTGASISSRLTWPPAGTPWSCSTTRPATQAAHAVTSATGRRQAIRRRPVSAFRIRAGLAAGPGLRYCQAAISAGPASATASVIPASSQPSPDDAASPGMTATAMAAPTTAAGTAATTDPRPISPATCRSDPPRARSMASSPARRTTSIRAASKITAAAITIRLTDSSNSTVSTPGLGAEEQGQVRGERRGDVQVVRGGLQRSGQRQRDRGGPVQGVGQPLGLVRAQAADRERELPLQLQARAGERGLHRGQLTGIGEHPARPVRDWRARPARAGSRAGPASRRWSRACCGRTIAVTASVTVPVGVTSVSRLPGCSPNRAAVCGVTATATVPAGSRPAE